jgi:hypothetical protein
MTNLKSWKDGEAVTGTYCGVPYVGKIQDGGSFGSRRTPDGRGFIFVVRLDQPIQIFGEMRSRIEIWDNDKNGSTIFANRPGVAFQPE